MQFIQQIQKTEKLFNRDFIIVMTASAGISFCNYFFSSTLPIYTYNLTGTTVYAGLMMTLYTLAALAMRLVTGLLSDRFGRVKLLIAGAALCAVACFLYSRSQVVAVLLIIRVLHGFGFGVHSTCGGAVAADVVPKSRMAEGLGIFGLYGTIASALGPGIALGIIGSGDSSGFRTLFYLAAGISAVCMILDTLIRYERSRKQQLPVAESTVRAVKATENTPLPKAFLGFEAGVIIPSIVIVFTFIGLSSITAFLTLYAKDRSFGNIGLFFTVSAAGMFLSRALLGKVSDRRGADIVVVPALITLVIALALIPLLGSPVWLIVIAAPLGLAQGAVCPAIQTMLIRRSSQQRRVSASAAYFASIDIGLGVGSALFGLIADRIGFSAVFWTSAGCTVVASAIYMLFLAGKKSVN